MDGDNQLFKFILITGAYLLPFILIPFMIKSLSGAFGNLAGMVNDKSKGLFDRQKNYRGNKRKEKRADAMAGNRFKGNNWAYRQLNRAGGYTSNIKQAGINPMRMRSNMRAYLGDSHYEHAMEQSEKLPGAKAFFSNDDLMMAGLRGEGSVAKTREYLRKKNYEGPALESMVSQVMNMRSQMGNEGFALAALSKLPATGTAYEKEEIADWYNDIATYTHGNKALQGTIVAAGKAGFRSAQRYEVSEAGFGDHMEAIKMAEKQEKPNEITKMIVDKAYAGGGAAAVVGSRNAKSAEMFAGAMKRDLEAAQKKVLETGDETHAYRALAAAASVQDQMASGKRIVTDVLSSEVLGKDLVGSGYTTLQEIGAARGDLKFQEARREYTSNAEATIAPTAAEVGAAPPPPKPGGPGV